MTAIIWVTDRSDGQDMAITLHDVSEEDVVQWMTDHAKEYEYSGWSWED